MLFWKLYKTPLLITCISLALYISFAYDLQRTNYVKLVSLYTALFFLFYKLLKLEKHNFKFLLAIAVVFRLAFIAAIPNLSQDFYRFIWDGRMLLEGFNPYLFTPESFLINNKFPVNQAQELYAGMGTLNGSHYTNYPPINQLCFLIAALFAKSSILGSAIVMRLLIIAADIGVIYFGKKLLEKLKLPVHHIFWYALNPFIIIELTGNLHFEGVMLFFLVWSLYLLHLKQWKLSGVILALSISVKLIPLIFLPLFYQWFIKKAPSTRLGITNLLSFYLIIAGVTLLLFLPFYNSEFIANYSQTVALWFNNFEFNASLYYMAREVGYWLTGHNEIAIIGKATPILVLAFTISLTFLRNNKTTTLLISTMLLVLTFYYFTATTIHPWYVATLLLLSVFTNYKFPLVWSFVIILSYLAYLNINTMNKSENLWTIALEYVIVYSVFIWDVFIKKPYKHMLKN